MSEKAQDLLERHIEKQKEQQEKNYLSPRDYVAYVLSGSGDKNWEQFSGANLDFFNRTMLKAEASTLSTASVLCTFADTLDNAISGPVLDRTRTRWGRVKPYLILTLPLFFISSFTPWVLPAGLSQGAFLLIFTIINYIGSIGNSFYTPAYSALLYNLTPNVKERNRLIATDTYVDLLGVWLPSLFPFFVDFLPDSIPRRSIYMGAAFIFIAIVIFFRIYGFFTLRERVPLSSRKQMNEVGVLKSLRMVISCRPMWVLMLKTFFSVGKAVGARIQNDFWLNCFGKISYGTIAGLFTGLPSYFVLPFAPRLTNKIGLKNLSILSYAICGVFYVIMFLVGYAPTGSTLLNVIWITVALTACGSLNSVQRYCSTALTGDMYDYVEWKTGIRNEGMLSAAMGYISLITNQASTLISGGLITALKIRSVYSVSGQLIKQNSPVMLRNIWIVFALCPGIGRILEGLVIKFFNVDGNTKKKMMEELATQRAQKIISADREDE